MNFIFKRRRLIVDRFQYRLLAISLVHFGFILLFFAAALFLPLMLRLEDPSLSWIEQEQAANIILVYNDNLWIPLGIIFLLLSIHSVFVSHRIAGPLYRFRAVLQTFAEGNLAIRANIRKQDYLQKEAETINEMIGVWENKIRSMKGQACQLQDGLVELKKAMNPAGGPDAEKALEGVEAKIVGLKGLLAQFKTTA